MLTFYCNLQTLVLFQKEAILCYQNIMRVVSSNSFGIIQGFITCHT